MAKIEKTVTIEGGHYMQKGASASVIATCWKNDGDHPAVTRYPIDGRGFKGLLAVSAKERFGLRFGDWVVEDQQGRLYVVDGARFAAQYVEVPGAVAPPPLAAVLGLILGLMALAALFPGDPTLPLLAGVTHLMYYPAIEGQWKGTANSVFDLDTDTMKVAAATNTYSPNQDTHDFFDDVTNEVTGTNYTAGGATLASVTVTRSSGTVTFDAADTVWTQHASGFTTARKFPIYRSTGTASTSRLFSVVTADGDVGNVTGDLTLQWNASGIATWTTT